MSKGHIHIYTASSQKATRYKISGMNLWIKNKPRAVFRCWNCGKRRQARNLMVQSYYDVDRFFCKECP